MENRIVVAGKRKTSIAKATIQPGSGKVRLNELPYENLPSKFHVLMIKEPIEIVKKTLGNFDGRFS